MRSLLVSRQPPRGTISLRDWVMEEGPRLGLRYHSELDRHFRPT
ncbi:MAG: hypothetical protein ACXWWQ_05910 [Candidatus Limnocylindria bacterium]